MEIDVNEIFGPVFQGEGPSAGQHSMFIRLTHCNLECTWCDTPYTWAFTGTKMDKHQSSESRGGHPYDKSKEIRSMEPESILLKLEELHDFYNEPTIIVISGGEPLMQGKQLGPLARYLNEYGCPVHIETAGTLTPPEMLNRYVTQYVVSPKLAHSGNTLMKRRKLGALRWFATNNAWFKFVMQSADDFDEIDEIVHEVHINNSHVMVMPEGTDQKVLERRAKLIEQGALARGYGLSMRQHITLHGDQRGF
jgi:7-carboxy-7-deazaguanine synthase